MKTLRQTKPVAFWAAIAALVMTFVFLSAPNSDRCFASADGDLNISDYCFRLDLTVENTSGTDLVAYPVRFVIPAAAMVTNEQMDLRAWDIKPTQGGIGNEIQAFLQDVDSNQSTWWLVVRNLPAGASRTVRVYIGNDEQKRNQGFQLTGNETLIAAANANYDIVDQLRFDVEIERASSTSTGELVDYLDAGNGYALSIVDVLGVQTVRATANTSTCDVAWSSSWNDVNTQLRYRFTAAAGDDLFIDADGVNVAACDTDEAAIVTPVGSQLYVGTDLQDTIVREVEIYDAGIRVADWGFDATGSTESSAVDPVYSGQIDDYSATGNPLIYQITLPQAQLDVAVAGLVYTTTGTNAIFSQVGADLNLNPIVGDIYSNTENTDAFGWDLFDSSLSNLGIPRVMGFAIFLSALGLILASGVFVYTRSVALSIVTMALPLTYGSINGWLPVWWVLIWGMLFITAYGAWQWSESN